ncbi:rhodanese-like domain-containing protein [Chryseobacterium piperi]|uniref:rhodanese-like domain-containing protein n=1 Tax=Chryseobacterium piperi TaxID=558152 RepID=UPI00068C9D33|nr:rhodanese-like domain-containing protein [Chryseobacterium piperi]ASW75469.1 rhodanese-like domain-containing protein [Chryseobacterium piperi]
MKYKIFGIIIASAFIWSACKTNTITQVPQMNIREIINSSDVTLVDVRVPEQYKEGSAKNAVNIPLAEIEKNIDFFKKQQKVVVFCNKGIQADQAMKILKKNGVENVYDGTSWKNIKAIQNENPEIR